MSVVKSEALLSFNKVGYDLSRFDIRRRSLLDHISFQLFPRSLTSIVGPNGAGKSTLVKLAVGELSPTRGTITQQQGLRIGYVPQRFAPSRTLPMTAGDFLALGNKRGADLNRRMQKRLAQTGFHRPLSHDLQACSGGELQRLLLARAIMRTPDLLILDEPLQGVDLAGQSVLYRLIADLKEELDCAVLMVSHDLHFVMADTDHVICLNGHICCEGHPEAVSEHPEYRKLIDNAGADNLGIYTHHHDHQHDHA